MLTNINLLKSKMVLHGDTNFVQCIADLLGISRTTASKKLNNEQPFTQPEIITLTKKYDLTADEIKNIFVGAE